jgi:hypothetical protein
MDADDLIVYRAWPTEAISDAVREFNDQMHDGAGIEELMAGLHGLDFLTRRSTVDDDLQARIDGAITEARMRIELIATKEAEDRTQAEQLARATRVIDSMRLQVDAMRYRFVDPGRFSADEVRQMVRLRIERAAIAKATRSAS